MNNIYIYICIVERIFALLLCETKYETGFWLHTENKIRIEYFNFSGCTSLPVFQGQLHSNLNIHKMRFQFGLSLLLIFAVGNYSLWNLKMPFAENS